MANSPIAPPPTAPIARTKTRDFVMKSQTALIDTFSWECCLNCEHWGEAHKIQVKDDTKYSGWREEDLGPGCTKFSADSLHPIRPPTKVILIGCEFYEPTIPF
jgi:hypothetical protein